MTNKPKCICGKEIEFVSDCCGAELITDCADEGTCCFICTKCNKPCDMNKKECHQAPEDKSLSTFMQGDERKKVYEKAGKQSNQDMKDLVEDKEQSEVDKFYSVWFGFKNVAGGDYFCPDPEEVRKYLRQNFISKREVEKWMEDMKDTADEENSFGYNQALRDLLNFIK